MQILPLASNSYLLETPEGPLLVDSGAPWENARLLRLLDELKPAALFLTHHHLDHVGGARLLWERYKLLVYAHPLDIPFVGGRKRRPPFPPVWLLGDWIANSARPLPQEALTAPLEGDRVMGWEVVHLPGHTLGQIGLLKDGILLAGDALRMGKDGPAVPADMVNADSAEARRTVGKIARLDVREIYVGHGPKTNPQAVRALAQKLGV